MTRTRQPLRLLFFLLFTLALPGVVGCLPQQLEPAAVIPPVPTVTLPVPLMTIMPRSTSTPPPSRTPTATYTLPPTSAATETLTPTSTATLLPPTTTLAWPTFTPEPPAPTSAPADTTPSPFDCQIVSAVPPVECQALLDLFQATNGWGWQRADGWLVAADPCTWYGLTCAEGHVVGVDLSSNQLTGMIPSSLSSLTQLTALALNVNNLSGSIPPELGSLTRLNYLYLSVNQLQGPIPPQLGQLRELRALWLGYNQLTGELPPQMGQMTQLFQLFVSDNQLSGPLPAELGNLFSLLELSVAENPAMIGPLPASLRGLNLVTFQYQGTGLCAPGDVDFQTWLASIGGLMGSGLVCP